MAGDRQAPVRKAAAGPIEWAFLDRDGTLNAKPPAGEYVREPDQLTLLPGAGAAVRILNRAGIWTAVVTNQRGVALGRMSATQLDAVHDRLQAELAREGAKLDAIYSCPHEEGTCSCRKPQGGMLLRAREEHPDLDFERAVIVGDSLNDIETGRRLGLRTLLLCGPGCEQEAAALADDVAADVLEAARQLTRAGARR